LIIFIGCHRSLKLGEEPNVDGTSSSTEKVEKEFISAEDAYKFPFIGSAALFSLYVAFKYFDKEIVNLLLLLYFSVIGTYTITNTLSPIMSQVIKTTHKYGKKFTKIPLLGDLDFTFTFTQFLCFILATIFSIFYFKTKHFILNNVLGISFSIQAIEKISLGMYTSIYMHLFHE
jgi:minor histocompatibility antigen H13